MKRPCSLVDDYQSDDDDEPPRKLPALNPSLLPTTAIDDPSKHQGRTRTTPHVEGQFAAYIYIPIIVDRKSKLHTLIANVLSDAKVLVPSLHEIGNDDGGGGGLKELHISLSRPTYLRAHQRDDLKRAVKAVSKTHPPFTASFAALSNLTNDERTRTFITLEIGAGHSELRAMSDALTPTLKSIRQKEFYSDPRFHASIAWALLDPPPSTRSPTPTLSPSPSTSPPPPQFPTISSLPTTLLPTLTASHRTTLSVPTISSFQVDTICLKIGKDVYRWGLDGSGRG